MMYSAKRFLWVTALSFVLIPAAYAQEPPATLTPQQRTEIEAQLKTARERLEATARTVAKLSSQLNGPVAYDYLYRARAMPSSAVLGVSIEDDADDRKNGVTVQQVVPQSGADKAGVKTGDVIITLNGKSLKDAQPTPGQALVNQMQTVKPGDKVKIELLRNGKKQLVDVVTQANAGAGYGALSFELPNDIQRLRSQPGLPGAFSVTMPEGPGQVTVMAPPRGVFFEHFIGTGVLDMELVALTPKLGRYFGVDKGLLVVRPPHDENLKLEEGDVIVDIDGRVPQDNGHAMRILRSYQPGEQATFNVMRDRRAMKVTIEMPKGGPGGVTLGVSPEEPQALSVPSVLPVPPSP